jgi:hypothetical protein
MRGMMSPEGRDTIEGPVCRTLRLFESRLECGDRCLPAVVAPCWAHHSRCQLAERRYVTLSHWK